MSKFSDPDAFYALNHTRENLIRAARQDAEEIRLALLFNKSESTNESRAVLVFLPCNIAKFDKEVKSLMLSISFMRTYQSVTMKTDLIVGTPRECFAYPEFLGCTEGIRTDFSDIERCLLLEHVPLQNRSDTTHPLLAYSNYIDSILVLSEFPYMSNYSVILRTDLDTFLTPGFGKWTLPHELSLVAGHGGYGSENANKHLSWIMKQRLGLSDEGLKGIGSTWIGDSRVMVATGKLTVSAMIWLHTQEFNKYEMGPAETDGWPYWHWPVLLLYAGHIAVNQIPMERLIITYPPGIKPNAAEIIHLDHYSSDNETMTDSVLHLHCWHTDAPYYAKHKFQTGAYKDLDLAPFIAMDSPMSYATTIAISSDRLSSEEFSRIVHSPSSIKNESWIRPNNII